MGKCLLITRPDHDDVTFYLSKWGEKIMDEAKENDFKILDLNGSKANRATFESYNSKNQVNFIIFNGHGDGSTVTGYRNEPLVQQGVNDTTLRSRIVYSISCSSASGLGKSAVASGATAYVGYTDDFVFFIDTNSSATPLNDSMARIFLNHSQTLTSNLLKGATVGHAHGRARGELERAFRASLTQDPSISRYLWWDYLNFVAIGDIDAKL
ncbi:MAG: hypothetical protein KGH66_02455 [Candidatus Micrarchaeota archaeon]|nr:hypothetical protein [Candidatus Micrarchaeota archaeon]